MLSMFPPMNRPSVKRHTKAVIVSFPSHRPMDR
jgi:hypothetical protein